MTYPPGTYLFSGPDTEDVLEMAKKYIEKEGYTIEIVKIVRGNGQINVVMR